VHFYVHLVVPLIAKQESGKFEFAIKSFSRREKDLSIIRRMAGLNDHAH